jgi:hypothetical protein
MRRKIDWSARTESFVAESREATIRTLNSESYYGKALSIRAPKVARTPPYEASPYGQLSEEEIRLRDILRSVVDCWISTGVGLNLVECPLDRTLEVQCPPYASFKRGSWTLRDLVEGDLCLRPLIVNSKGRFSVDLRPDLPKVLPSGLAYGSRRPDPFSVAERQAGKLFTALVLSGDHFRIAKCGGCKLYYFLSLPRSTYKRGCFCRWCNSAQCATSRTKEIRQLELRERMAAAVMRLREWETLNPKQRGRYRDVKAFIAAKMIKLSVKRNWVSLHWEEIQKSFGQK